MARDPEQFKKSPPASKSNDATREEIAALYDGWPQGGAMWALHDVMSKLRDIQFSMDSENECLVPLSAPEDVPAAAAVADKVGAFIDEAANVFHQRSPGDEHYHEGGSLNKLYLQQGLGEAWQLLGGDFPQKALSGVEEKLGIGQGNKGELGLH